MLSPSQNGAAGGQWTSDPNDLSASSKPEVIVESSAGPGGESLHGNGLIFHSAPFKKETEFDGQMDLQLSLQMDVPDTDLEALLLVTPMVSPINWRMRCHAGGIAILCRILSRFP
jgi:hypothetical protein